ncbi:MAG: YceI family protein [Spartobacteria bacterium]
MMKIGIYVALLAIVVASSASANEVYTFDQSQSKIGFKIHHFVGVTPGKFTKFSGKIDIDREHPERSSVTAAIDVRSIDTGILKRDEHLRSAEFFNAAKFPQINFRSRSCKQTGPQSADVIGDITMHGVTRSIVLHVDLTTVPSEVKRTRWSVTTAPLRRSEFGLMFSKTAEAISGIGQEVAIEIEIEATKAR